MAVAHLPSRLFSEFKPSLSTRQVKNLGKDGPKFFCFNGNPQVHVNNAQIFFSRRVHFSHDREIRHLSFSAQATGSGVQASFADAKEEISLRDVQIAVESREDDKVQVRVDLSGEETERVFDDVLKKLARTAPPVPGFRKTKGGKTSNIPKSFLLQILGRDRVYKFIIQEIVSTTMRDYVSRENLKVGNKCNTIQTAEELESTFAPGSTFGFNAILEFESESETPDSSSSEE